VSPARMIMSIQSGNAQRGVFGHQLPVPLSVLVTDRSGVPLAGAIVQFKVTPGFGKVTPGTLRADAQGLASTLWTLGKTVDEQTVEAILYDFPDTHVQFSARAEAPVISIVSGNNQTASGGHALPSPLAVRVTTPEGIPLPGVTVDWETGIRTLAPTDSDGLAYRTWALSRNVGTQTATAALLDFPAASVTFSANAILPAVILGYDGASWRTVLADTGFTGLSFWAIWGSSPSDVYAVGTCVNNAAGVRYNGASWAPLRPSPCDREPSGQPITFVSVGGNSASDIFFLWYIAPHSPSFTNIISHYDGQAWTDVGGRTYNCCHALNEVWSRATNDVFSVDDEGRIEHYDGSAWKSEQTGTTVSLLGVWGPAGGPDVFAVGNTGTILHYDGTSWNPQPSGTTSPLYAVWGTSSRDVFAVGGRSTPSGPEGIILHYDGTTWSSQTVPGAILHAIWGTSSNSVFAVGDYGTILHYDGATWTRQAATSLIDLRGVWGSSPTNIFAVGLPR